jgi:ABC-type branched-subunit amino acid transport system substrate-binding protein
MRSRTCLLPRALAVATASLLLLAACGDDSGNNAADSGGAEGSPVDVGPTRFKVMVIGDITSANIAFTVPESVPAVKAALKNTPAEVTSCDSKGDPEAATACQKKAVSDGVDAVVLAFQPARDIKPLVDAKIPVIGVSPDFTSPTSFAMASSFAQYAAMGKALAQDGCTKLGILFLDATDFLVDYITAGFESEGGKEVARAPLPINAADPTAAIATLTGAGAECIALSVVPTQVAQAVTAVNQAGKELPMAGVGAIFSKDVVESLGDSAEGILIVDNVLNGNDDQDGINKFKADMKSFDKNAEATGQAVLSYVSGRYLAAALATVPGEGTPENVLAALASLRDVDFDGIAPKMSSTELAKAEYKRLINHYGITYKIKDGKPEKSGDFFDLGPILDQIKTPAS